YGALAQEKLERARAGLDTTALADIARRYPLTPAGRDAWWTLGDLEAEVGNLEGARAAWKRAAQALGEGPLPSELAARVRWSPGESAINSSRAHFLALGAAADAHEIPAPDAHGWEKPLRIEERQGSPLASESFNSFPVVAGDRVLASNSMTLVCADALTGAPRWRSPEPPGWASVRAGNFRARDGSNVPLSGFFEGLDREGLMIAPAAGSGIAVAALQVPFTQNGNNYFNQQIRITTVIPDRRLFAFDLESGKPLWNHCPPPTWDCDSGSFTTRMRVAGPPVIAGSRVLVPVWRPQGRIFYCVACYDLSTGAYLWSTQIASGQRPLNMFGRLDREFCAPPLVVEGEKVIALTQLGTIAALDLFSGEILWQTVYNQVRIPQANGMQAGERSVFWRNAPPAVSDGMVIATPFDSEDMLGIDLEDGAVRWSFRSNVLGEGFARSATTWCLLGAHDDTVFVGGRLVLALRARDGLAKSTPKSTTRSEFFYGEGFSDPWRAPRAVLTERNVIVPTKEGSLILDRLTLQGSDGLLASQWGSSSGAGFGNLAVGDGALYSVSGQNLWGVLDWHSIELRLEEDYRAHPDDAVLATHLGEFLRERAASEKAALKPQAALEHLLRAEKVLGTAANAGNLNARVALFSTLRLEAKVRSENGEGSLEPLERAARLAPDGGRLALVLADIVRNLRVTDPRRVAAALTELEQRCGKLEFAAEDSDVGRGRGSEARSVLRWVIEQRVSIAAERMDRAEEFAALIDLLDRCGDEPLSPAVAEPPGESRETPALRIERRLASGARAAWQPFEEKARVALIAARASGEAAALERVARLFPHTAAARESRDARLRLAVEAGDAAASVRAAFEELPDDWSAQNSTPRQARMLWLAAQGLKANGNPRYAASLLLRLAQFQPDVVADERDSQATFAVLARAAESAASGAPSKPPRFNAPWEKVDMETGETVLLGELDLGGKSVFVVASRDRFTAFGSDGARVWTRPVEGAISPTAWLSNALLVDGVSVAGSSVGARVVLTWKGGVQALDAATGEDAWNWDLPGQGQVLEPSLACDGGVLTLSMRPAGGAVTLVGLDVGRGTPLWEHPCGSDLWQRPVVGSGVLVLLPRLQPTRPAEVLEIATGTSIRSLETGQIAPIEDVRAAWIEGSRIVLPHFAGSRGGQDAVVAYDFDTGARTWRVPSDEGHELASIVRCGSDTYLLYRSSGIQSAPGNLKELDTRIGAVREIPGVTLGAGDVAIGIADNGVTRLAAPYLFLRSSTTDGKDETLLRSIHLPYGRRWSHRLPLSANDPYARSLPLPAISSHLVAFAYMEAPRGGSTRNSRTRLIVLQRESGDPGPTTDLPQEMGRSETMELATFGNLLIVCGKDRTMILAGSETEEQR
ncbi:MAG TPA: PQQ-binding-like beta-propeller repeat protein, partial [Planctomycetota bacterium]|nr:PQQ-binding-like beta-propeller repeat protein [Planctomycetota bacterium]